MRVFQSRIFWALVAVFLQKTVAPLLTWGGIGPDFVFILVLYLGLYGSPVQAMVLGFVLGFIVDSLTWSPFGLNSLIWTITGFVPHLFRARLFLASPATQLAFIVSFSVGSDLIQSFYYLTLGQQVAQSFLLRVGLHTFWSVFLFLLFYRIWKRAMPIEGTT